MPKDHGCQDGFFAIDPRLDSELRRRYYSMLLAAKSTKSNVEIGYDKKSANCTSGRPIVESMSLDGWMLNVTVIYCIARVLNIYTLA